MALHQRRLILLCPLLSEVLVQKLDRPDIELLVDNIQGLQVVAHVEDVVPLSSIWNRALYPRQVSLQSAFVGDDHFIEQTIERSLLHPTVKVLESLCPDEIVQEVVFKLHDCGR